MYITPKKLQKISKIAASIALLTSVYSANAFEFHGYVRSGIHEAGDGGQQKYLNSKLGRLGNETDGWWDMIFAQELLNDKDSGKSIKVAGTLEGTTDQLGGDEYTWGDPWGGSSHMGMMGFYAAAKGYIAAAPEATLWIGKRSALTREIQMLDYKAVKEGGTGFGIENLQAGPGLFGVNLMRRDAKSSAWNSSTNQNVYDTSGNITGYTTNTTSNTTTYNVDWLSINYTKVPLAGDATIDFIGQYGYVNKSQEQKDLEAAGTIQKAENSFIPTIAINKPVGKGFNETYFQYSTKRAANGMATLSGHDMYAYSFGTDYSKAEAYRFINTGEIYLTDDVVMAHSLVYQHGKNITSSIDQVDSFNAVIRPAYIWNTNNKTALEIGYLNQVNKTNGENLHEKAKKVTLAHIISAGPSLLTIRPDFRFYTTYIKSDENEIDNWSFRNNKDDQLSFGAQVEAWW